VRSLVGAEQSGEGWGSVRGGWGPSEAAGLSPLVDEGPAVGSGLQVIQRGVLRPSGKSRVPRSSVEEREVRGTLGT
jgi:hypothetical protein